MKRETVRYFLILQILVLGVLGVFAQDQDVTRSEFLTFMKRSDEATKASPYRKNVTFETGDAPDGAWKPYSSMVEEVIMPDRSHLIYKTGPAREFIRVGKTRYGKELNGPWVLLREEAEGMRVSPSSEPVFNGPVVEYRISNPSETDRTAIIKVISKPDAGAANFETRRLFYTFSFDEKGVLRQHTSIAFNGKNWVKSTENYEYDPNIRIEAPMN